jgi:ABC-type transporter Mla subunit MlaD
MSNQTPSPAPRALQWIYHALAIVAFVTLIFLLNDLRREFQRTGETVNRHLPEILEKTRTSTETLARLSEDIRQLRDLAGATNARDATLAKYADELLDAIEAAPDARIGVEAIIGSGLKDARPAKEWTADARKEAVYLAFAASSRQELLERLTRNKFGRDWLIQEGNAPPVKLIEWLNAKRPATLPR